MATQTTHYSLVKPGYDEAADIAVINGNMDTLDAKLYSTDQDASAAKTATTVQDITTSVSTTNVVSGITIESYKVKKYGKLIELDLSVKKSSAVNAGNNTGICTFAGLPNPSIPQRAVGYNGASLVVSSLSDAGVCQMRVWYSNLSSNTTVNFIFMYLTE